ncbi:MAG: 2,3-bisphosphoglycerate-independent phosphoglycerate mutase [Bdellovibrionales bacterium]|nr:2,3-bisphosphoglycerate-independent phosphoglycerate mutase [Bdellovibrionales bacterium]
MPSRKPKVLCILDGFGLSPETSYNAVALANTPNFDRITREDPSSTLITFGERVGLPAGQMGNSEVGHMNIGAGRVVEQWLLRIDREFKSESFKQKKSYQNFVNNLSSCNSIHLIGLFSDGGVHSHFDHLKLLLDQLQKDSPVSICLHLITDGRDTAPDSSLNWIIELEKKLENNPQIKIASIIGRYYAMDRDTRWERTKQAFDLIVNSEASQISLASNWIKKCYQDGITDEFIPPAVLNNPGIDHSSAVIFWNFREDRMRQIVAALTQKDFKEFERSKTLASNVLCFTDYDHDFNLPILFDVIEIKNHLGEVVSLKGLKQLRVAETEKYPHVTYFINAGIEDPFPGEDRKLIPSPRDVDTYDQKPEMSAYEVCEIVTSSLRKDVYDLIIVNFANCDMVGHTGVLEAAITAVETVDSCLGKIIEQTLEQDGVLLVIADHGNAEQMLDYNTGKPHTAHTTNPVPIVLIAKDDKYKLKDNGALCDIAPTILELLNLDKPKEMTGESLLIQES